MVEKTKIQNKKNITRGKITIVIIFLVLFIFIIVIFFVIGLTDPIITVNPINEQTGEFLSLCTEKECGTGLKCDGVSFLCKKIEGEECIIYTDCVSGLICSGICATGPIGGLNELCPCNNNYICIEEEEGPNICKGLGGVNCETNSDCISNNCNNNICTDGVQLSYPCQNNTQCESNNCSSGYCQPQGYITGVVGSSCSGSCININGAECGDELTCLCQGENEPGICVTASNGVQSLCTTTTPCVNTLSCTTNENIECTNTDINCNCKFSYNNPNILNNTNCINGMTERNNECFNNNGLGCDSSGLCINNNCGGQSVMAGYSFELPNNQSTNLIFTTSINQEIKELFPGPTGLINPYKMFATSQNTIDTIYLIDHINGLLSITYDLDTSTILSNWNILIPYNIIDNNSNKTLIDVSYNGNYYIVAFNEIISSTNGNLIQNDVIYIGSSLDNLTPFNYQEGQGITGTQYTNNNNPLTINYISISEENDVPNSGNDVLISSNGSIYIKSNDDDFYSLGIIGGGNMNGTPMTSTTGPARFYYDIITNTSATGPIVCPGDLGSNNPIQCPSINNISLVSEFQFQGETSIITIPQILQFSGNIAGIILPFDLTNQVYYKIFDYDIYSPTTPFTLTSVQGMNGSSIITLFNTYSAIDDSFIGSFLSLSVYFTTTIFPYRISPTSRVACSANSFYILSIGSCQ